MKIALLLFIAVAFLIGLVRYLEASIFYPTHLINATPKDLNLPFEDIFFKTNDNLLLNGWFIPSSGGRSTLIFFHGNAGNIGDRLEKIALFHKMGLNIFIIDYRGYGLSQGRPEEMGFYNDATAAYDYLVNRKDVNAKNIVAYGASLGGAVAIDLATKRQVACLISESTFSSAADMSKRLYPFIPAFLLKTRMDSMSKVKALSIPKLFIHSSEDEVVPFSLGKKLFEAALSPKEFLILKGGHNEGFMDSEPKFSEGISHFLKNLNLI